MSNADYHADFSAVSCSMLKVFMESRREYEARYITRTIVAPPPSDSMRLGSLAHAYLLDESELASFAVIPESVLASNGARMGAKWKEFEANNAGKTLLKASEADAARAMVTAVRAKCGDWFASAAGYPEHEIRWTDKHSGLPCKAKLDYDIPGFIFDFKTAKSSSPKAFRGSVKSYRYDIQEAHYTDGIETLTGAPVEFLFVVVKSEPPHQCRVMRTPDIENIPDWRRIDKAWGRQCREEAMQALAGCYASGDWSDPGENDVAILYEDDCR